MHKARRRAPRAFTLLELIVVLGIISLLATLIVPRVVSRLGQARPVVTKQQIANAASALESYKMDVGVYPTTEQGLRALIERPSSVESDRWRGPYLTRKAVPVDGWGNPLRYRAPASEEGFEYEVYSYGADDKEGGEGENGDIYSWSE